MQKNLAVGMLAHVDAGKTTLTEGMLFQSGALKRLGRVDHQDAFLDTDAMERKRGITIFSKQAVLPLEGGTLTLLDTPGHVDFSAEMERTLGILDYAILVISGSEGIQGHTVTLWQLLARYQVPTFLFLNKMDLAGAQTERLMEELKKRLHPGCVSFSGRRGQEELWEEIALCDDEVLARYLEDGAMGEETVASLIGRRLLFPCYFGSALRLEGIDALLRGLEQYTRAPRYPELFGAKVFKISRDDRNVRLTHLKVTGGKLAVRTPLTNRRPGLAEEQVWTEKVHQIRVYSGEKYQAVEEVPAGAVCAVTGLNHTRTGMGLGEEESSPSPLLEPALSFRMLLPEGCDPHHTLRQLRQLEEEDPQLAFSWSEQTQEIRLRLMGEIQLEILRHVISERFGLEVSFDAGSVLYRETIAQPVIGMGHFEPLRHYAEVHLLLEPGPRGSGLQFGTVCSEDVLSRHWQRLILSHLRGEHPGVLTGAPITDMKITLLTGRAHNKHTEGGDFRQATHRALRQGLMQAKILLLEPFYRFQMELPKGAVGRAMNDLQPVSEDLSLSSDSEESALLTGKAPVSFLRGYASEMTAYTRGLGRISLSVSGFAPCADQDKVVSASGYQPLHDVEHPADSVFCANGAGYLVPWDQVKEHMHLDSSGFLKQREEGTREEAPSRSAASRQSSSEQLDKELLTIFEQTYGPVKRRDFLPRPPKVTKTELPSGKKSPTIVYEKPDYLLVDGYNIIHAWEDLSALAQRNMDAARQSLMDILSNYRGFHQREIILVFDAYRVPGGVESVSRYHNISVVYTKEAETADAYIEKVTYRIGKKHRVTVATSDGTIQLIIWGHGALRISAKTLRAEIEQTKADIAAILDASRHTSFTPSHEQTE